MKTKRDISTISYNTKDFIYNVLYELYKAHKIAFFCGVCHIGETLDDGTQEKDHIHLFVEPNEKLDTMDLIELSKEVDPVNPDKPLKTIFWHYSDWDNWLLYDMHDKEYLRLKLQKRDYTYSYEDFFYSDEDEFFERYNKALHSSKISDMLRLPKLLKDNSVAELTALGYVRPEQALTFKAYEELLSRGKMELEHKRKHD